METKNAIIESIRFDTERGLTIWVELNYGGSGQCFGGWQLYTSVGWKDGPNVCGRFIVRLLEVVGVNCISQAKGKAVRVQATDTRVESIGHITKEDWFSPSVDFAQYSR